MARTSSIPVLRYLWRNWYHVQCSVVTESTENLFVQYFRPFAWQVVPNEISAGFLPNFVSQKTAWNFLYSVSRGCILDHIGTKSIPTIDLLLSVHWSNISFLVSLSHFVVLNNHFKFGSFILKVEKLWFKVGCEIKFCMKNSYVWHWPDDSCDSNSVLGDGSRQLL